MSPPLSAINSPTFNEQAPRPSDSPRCRTVAASGRGIKGEGAFSFQGSAFAPWLCHCPEFLPRLWTLDFGLWTVIVTPFYVHLRPFTCIYAHLFFPTRNHDRLTRLSVGPNAY